jgi:MFS family permease
MVKVNSIPALILSFCLVQLWTNVATAPYQAMMPDMVPKEHQGTASAYMGMSGLLGQLGGLICCGLLIEKPGGLWMIMVTFSLLMIATMLYTVWRIPEPSAESNPAAKMNLVETIIESFRINAREHLDFIRLIVSRFIINMGFYTCTGFFLYYVTDALGAARPVKIATQIFIISTISGILGNFPAGILGDRVSKKAVIYLSCTIASTGALVFLLAGSTPVALAASFVFGIGFGAFMAVDWAFATNLLPDKDEAKYMGVWHIAFTVPQVIAPFIGGIVAYFFNRNMGHGMGYRAVLALAILYLAIGTIAIRPIRERIIRKTI